MVTPVPHEAAGLPDTADARDFLLEPPQNQQDPVDLTSI